METPLNLKSDNFIVCSSSSFLVLTLTFLPRSRFEMYFKYIHLGHEYKRMEAIYCATRFSFTASL